MTRTGRPRPPAVAACPSCVPSARCPEHQSERDKAAAQDRASKRWTNGKALSWVADVPVPFKPVTPLGIELEERPPISSMPPQPAPEPPFPYQEPPTVTHVVSTTSGADTGMKFVDAAPLLARANLRKELEVAALEWLRLREGARGTGRDSWDGRRVSPGELRAAEDAIERITKKLRGLT